MTDEDKVPQEPNDEVQADLDVKDEEADKVKGGNAGVQDTVKGPKANRWG